MIGDGRKTVAEVRDEQRKKNTRFYAKVKAGVSNAQSSRIPQPNQRSEADYVVPKMDHDDFAASRPNNSIPWREPTERLQAGIEYLRKPTAHRFMTALCRGLTDEQAREIVITHGVAVVP